MLRAIGFAPDGAGSGPSDPEETDDVDDGDTLALLVVRPSGKPEDALEEAAATKAALEITEEIWFAALGTGPAPLVLCCKPAPNVREYVSRRDTSDGTLLPPAAAKCCAAAGPYKLR